MSRGEGRAGGFGQGRQQLEARAVRTMLWWSRGSTEQHGTSPVHTQASSGEMQSAQAEQGGLLTFTAASARWMFATTSS